MHRSLGITVSELLDLPILKNAKILSGEGGLQRRVTKVNVMEVPDIIDWVTPGEILLTTTYSIKDNIERLKNLITEFNGKELAGIGIKTKRYIDQIPDEILEISNELNFPLIEIPYGISYSDIIMAVSTEIINKQTNTLIIIDRFHNQLINIMLKGGSLKEICNTIFSNINNSVAIKENIFESHIISSEKDMHPYLEGIILKDDNDDDLYVGIDSNTYRYAMDKIKGKEVRRIMIPIRTEFRNYGYIYIWEDKRELTPIELSVIESSTSIVALDIIKRLSNFQIESKHKIEFLDDLLSDNEKRQKKAIDQGVYFGFNKEQIYAVIIIKANNIDKHIKHTPNNKDYLHHLNERLLSIMEKLPKPAKGKLIYGSKSDSIVALFSLGYESTRERAKKEMIEFCQMILSYAEMEHIQDIISIGIGRAYKNINELWRSYKEARRAVENRKPMKSTKVTHYDDLGIYRILSYEDIQPELVQFYKEILEPLVAYDKEKNSELVETLRKYCECGGNLKQVSNEMYTHYNTIIYRMKRISEITKINLENYEDRLNVEISLKVYDMIKNNDIMP